MIIQRRNIINRKPDLSKKLQASISFHRVPFFYKMLPKFDSLANPHRSSCGICTLSTSLWRPLNWDQPTALLEKKYFFALILLKVYTFAALMLLKLQM